MVSDTYKPTKKEKQQAQQSYKEKKIQSKDLRKLQKTTKDFTSQETLQKTPENHGKWQSSSSSDGLD